MSNHSQRPTKSDSYQVIAIKEIDYSDEQTVDHSETFYKEQLNVVATNVEQAKKKLHNLQKEQSQLIEKTNEQIKLKKQEWEEEKETVRQQAEKAGYQDGFQAGKQEALKQYESTVEEINQQYELAVNDYSKIIDNHRHTIINLAMATANKILNEQLANDPESYSNIVTSVINDLKDNETITIIVHPNNYQYVYEQREELEQLIDEDGIITLQIDSTFNEGDCIIKHRFGQIDASIDVQLQQIKVALKESVLEN